MATDSVGPLSRGSTLGSRYTLANLLGVGGMASVWLARDRQLERTVAVKVIADTLAADPVWVRRFEREARAVASLSHPNIVRVFDFGSEHGRPYLVMQYVPGGSLGELLERREQVDAEDLARQLLGAVAQIHATGLLHRDIKPANVLLAGDASPLLTDFGIAHHSDATRLTSTGDVVGTVRYLAPEVLSGAPPSVRSDLFACGRLLEDVLAAGDGAAPGLRALAGALTAADPEARPASAVAALELLRGGAPAGTLSHGPDHGPLKPEAGADPATGATTVLDGTRPTLAMPRRARAATAPAPPIDHRPPRGAGALRDLARRARARPRAAALSAAALVLIVLAIVLAAGSGGGSPSRAAAPAPAASSAALSTQLDALSRRVRYATRR